MRDQGCWIIENYVYRRCESPRQHFASAVSLHNHSCYSVENLASLNDVVKLFFMRPLSGTLRWAFGLDGGVNYADMVYNPPYTPGDVYRIESAAAQSLGFDGVHLAITDHDECAGSVEFLRQRPDLNGRLAIGEEVSIRFQGHPFHLGVSGLPLAGIDDTHLRIQSAARTGAVDELFEILAATGCLVVFNHPLIPWGPGGATRIPAADLLARYGWAIHALEYNGMRRREENDAVLALAREWRKPVVGGGDSHLLAASSVICASQANSFAGFIAEVKDGRAAPIVRNGYFAPLRWKLFLRVLYFIAHYRRIASYRGVPVAAKLAGRTVLLDPAGYASRAFLAAVSSFGLVR
jgi:predicted metal-dependent phosphoesterase TrpH